jgi:hypothetical protein
LSARLNDQPRGGTSTRLFVLADEPGETFIPRQILKRRWRAIVRPAGNAQNTRRMTPAIRAIQPTFERRIRLTRRAYLVTFHHFEVKFSRHQRAIPHRVESCK